MALENPHVLIVDDAHVDRFVAARVFDIFNVRVTAVGGVLEALEFLYAHDDVDLVLTEYCMPGMTGYDLLLEMQESPTLNHIPVVIACTDIIPERINECLNEGAQEYIIKPLKIADVPRILSYI
ncbi:hypothetical protein BS78_03G011300 [Paspalum vaginatum]|nr:hypothetical protein BS78_03G011300 [Paspalum vaginatum]